MDGLNAGYANALLEQYLENPDGVPDEWRTLFESGASELVATHPGLARLVELLQEDGNGHVPAAAAPAASATSAAICPVGSGHAGADASCSAASARQDPLPGRRRRDGPRHGVPHPRPPRRASRPARRRARRRPCARPGAPRAEADPGAAAPDPGGPPRRPRSRRHARRGPAAATPGLLRHERLRARAHLRPRAARLAANGDRVASLPPHARRRRQAAPARAPDRGRGLRALSAPGFPRPEAVLRRGARRDDPDAGRDDRPRRGGGRPRGRARHGAPRPAERARPRARPSLRDDPARVRGRAHARGCRGRSRGRHRRRQVPPRRRGHAQDPCGRDHRHARVEPESPRGRRSRRRGPYPRRADRPLDPHRLCRLVGRDGCPDPRRRGLPGAGRRRGDAQPRRPERLLDGRLAAPDREQPDRLHHRPGRRALDPVLERPRQGLRPADHPRQRRRPRGRALLGSAGDGVPPPLRHRRGNRPRRLSPPRPQRAGRGRLHAAADGSANRAAAERARAVRAGAARGRRRHAGRPGRDGRPRRHDAEGGPRAPEDDLRPGRARGRLRGPHPAPRPAPRS